MTTNRRSQAMIYEIFMPTFSSTMTEGKIVEWTKSPRDKVEKGETVLVVESDKADMNIKFFNRVSVKSTSSSQEKRD